MTDELKLKAASVRYKANEYMKDVRAGLGDPFRLVADQKLLADAYLVQEAEIERLQEGLDAATPATAAALISISR